MTVDTHSQQAPKEVDQATSDDLIAILADLVSFKTVSGNDSEIDACFDYLEDYLVKSKLHVSRMTSNKLPSLVATTQVTTSPKVLLQAHIDVVPAKLDYFKLTKKDTKLYGRGTYDMKFAAACYLKLIQELQDELQTYDFGIMFTSDEEIGGENGVSYLLNNGYSADVCILPDGGNDWRIETTCNAVWIVGVTANGQSAHGSRPWEGSNAINTLVEGLSEIQALFGELKPYKNSITISKIQGGSAANQVPDQAEAIIDMRFINDPEYAEHRAKITQIAQEKNLTLETVAYVKARNVNTDQPHIKKFLEIAANMRGQPITKTHSFGASDACFFANHGIPVIVMRPTGDGAHSDHEWIETSELLQFHELIKAYIVETARI
jgi:succinyl-diaminopimelate desuccinylase